eukprot:757118-Hanusia_phi.AAC.2
MAEAGPELQCAVLRPSVPRFNSKVVGVWCDRTQFFPRARGALFRAVFTDTVTWSESFSTSPIVPELPAPDSDLIL